MILSNWKKIQFIVSLLIVVQFCNCASSPTAKNEEIKKINVEIKIKHIIKTDSWQVSYSLSSPVAGLMFDRDTNKFRHKDWQLADNNLEIKDTNDGEILSSKNQALFSNFTLIIKTNNNELDKDYNLFFKFKDGSILIYTGHFNLRFVLNEKLAPDNSYRFNTTFLFIPDLGESVYISNKQYTKPPIVWSEFVDEGTYVYFGKSEPIITKSMIAIFDKGLPEWLKKKANELFPKLFEYYETSFGYPIDFKPLIYFGYEPLNHSGLNTSGNVLPGLIQLEVEGKRWEEFSKEGLVKIIKFLAHESAHLWNSKSFHYEKGISWMHEGGAEIAAFTVLKEFGIVSKNRYFEIMSKNLNQCISGLSGISLNESFIKRRFQNYYTCGTIIGLITDASIKQTNPNSKGIMEFWRDLFNKAKSNENTYTQDMYFSLLLDKTKKPELVEGLKKLVNGPIDDSSPLVSLLLASELKVTPVEKNFSKEDHRDYGKKAMREIMSCDCHGTHSFSSEDKYLSIEGSKECNILKDNVKIDRIGNYSILENGISAYEFAYKNGQQNDTIILGIYNSKNLLQIKNCKIPVPPIIYRIAQ